MSLREEEKRKSNCPSRGLGLAAAAIGVGVGAALYYVFSKRPENPDAEGSTSGWGCEQPHAFNIFHEESETIDISSSSESEYSTISEGTTTDTSVHESDAPICITSTDESVESISDEDSFVSDFDSDEWDMTQSSLDIPEAWSQQSTLRSIATALFPSPVVTSRTRRNTLLRFRVEFAYRYIQGVPKLWDMKRREQENRDLLRAQALSREEHVNFLRTQRFRERSWSLEECSICFEIMLKDQDLTALPCSHNFHSTCIAPWLAEQQTCPNCRKAAE